MLQFTFFANFFKITGKKIQLQNQSRICVPLLKKVLFFSNLHLRPLKGDLLLPIGDLVLDLNPPFLLGGVLLKLLEAKRPRRPLGGDLEIDLLPPLRRGGLLDDNFRRRVGGE